ncbi:Cleavage and polyadenylation specificity factor subunit 3 [Entophlyctis luteolus]|nr:Cleavage and polyadenylation specificity factor subunit 3 [Entophlyctis luteolus]
MTHPTKAIFKWLLADYVKVSNLSVDDMLYSEKDLLAAYDRIETVDFHQQVDVDGIKFTPFHAGHVLGAAMFLVEIAGVKVLYTGDYSTEEDRHLMAAEQPPNVTPDVLIAESTYDKRNGVIIPGYVVEGTLGKQILSQPPDIPAQNGGARLPLRLTVEYISFSAHVDFAQNSAFIDAVGAPNLVLVHGEQNEMGRLRSALVSRFEDREVGVDIYTPKNCEAVELYFKGEKMAKTIGSLAQFAQKESTRLEGVLVSKDFTFRLMAPDDLLEYTDLVSATLSQRLVVASRAPPSLVRWHLEAMYGKVKALDDADVDDDLDSGFVVFHTVHVKCLEGRYSLEWMGNEVNDMIADSIIAVVIQAESCPASVKATRSAHSHTHGNDDHEDTHSHKDSTSESATANESSDGGSDTEYEEMVSDFFQNQFGPEHVILNSSSRRSWTVQVDTDKAQVLLERGKPPVVIAESDELRRRVKAVAGRVAMTLGPVAETWHV